MNEVEAFYNEVCKDEWERLARHKIEFDITKRYMIEFIKENSSVLDVGGGPGRYSVLLAKHGHKVTLFDLSSENINLAKRKAMDENVEIIDYIHGNALELPNLISNNFDVVLCMGPLYHLTEEIDRKKVVANCITLLKPGGILFASFISSYAPIVDLIKKYPENIVGAKDRLLKYFKDGRNIVSNDNPGFTEAYFINPNEIEEFMKEFDLDKKVITGVEGLPTQSEAKINSLPKEAYEEWLDLIYQTSTNPMTWASCEHFLYIGQKK